MKRCVKIQKKLESLDQVLAGDIGNMSDEELQLSAEALNEEAETLIFRLKAANDENGRLRLIAGRVSSIWR